MIGIVNTGFGNTKSINNIYFEKGIDSILINEPSDFKKINKIILPGIGSFDTLTRKLNDLNFTEILSELVLIKEMPILGICIGMHIFFESSNEGKSNGFGWIKGNVKRIDSTNLRLPHMGWNRVHLNINNNLFNDIQDGSFFYFLHSFGGILNTEDSSHIAYTNYGKKIISSVNYKNIYGVQFHPEKSHSSGIKLLTNFAKINA